MATTSPGGIVQPAFPPRVLRDAFGLFPTGVAVITAAPAAGPPLGMTVSSFNSVSLNPPLVLFSLARVARGAAAWEAVTEFAVNILGENQGAVSSRFAGTGGDKWDGVDPLPSSVVRAPLIRDCLVWFECRTWARHDGGDHLILIGEIVHIGSAGAEPRPPLVFSRGRYHRLHEEDGSARAPGDDPWLHGW